MTKRYNYPTPSVNKGKKLLSSTDELNDPVYINKVLRFLKKQKPENIKTANLRENDCLNSSQENIIFNDSNNMILNTNTLDSFFEKLAESMTGGTSSSSSSSSSASSGGTTSFESSQSSSKKSNMSGFDSNSNNRNNWPYQGQKMAGNYINHKNKKNYSRVKQNNVPDGIV